MLTKQEARKTLFALRRNFLVESPKPLIQKQYEEFSTWIIQNPSYRKAKKVGVYSAIGDEFPLDIVIDNALKNGKEVYFPFVRGKNLIWKRVRDIKFDLIKGFKGISEPKLHLKELETHLDIVLVPGVGFTPTGIRIGLGQGFYDRYLSQSQQTWKLGVCWDCQIVEHLPSSYYDVEMDEVVTISYETKATILNNLLEKSQEK